MMEGEGVQGAGKTERSTGGEKEELHGKAITFID